ncbi:phage tail sheath family protein [Enterobacteriaceae bacterium LUAb1]
MKVTTRYPGVYLREEAASGFSVNSAATAVPVFAYRRVHSHHVNDNIQIYHNWAAFAAAHSASEKTCFYTSLKLWFMHGGGKCYLADEKSLTEAAEKYDDITLMVAAGTETTLFAHAFSTVVSKGYRIFGLFDGPQTKIATTDQPDAVMQSYPASSCAAVFWPWCCGLDWGGDVPPSAVAAAAITQTDRDRGVWKAPANQVIKGVIPKYPVSDDLQGHFNQRKALNMIRTFSGLGTVVWGARTLEDSDNWRYIPVRRLFNTVEQNIQKALHRLIFEPNNQPTWQRVKAAVDNYLHALWQQGALAGNSPAEAWFVQIGKDITMSAAEIQQGKMVVNIGLAAVRPAEFIILQFSQDIAQ